MRGRVIGAVSVLVLALTVATAFGQGVAGPYPRLRGGVAEPPREAVAGAPFDVAKLFEAPPPDRDAATRNLEALAEFSVEVVTNCYPEGPERDRRAAAVTARTKRLDDLQMALIRDPNAVAGSAIDAVVAEYREGFRKLAEAQTRDRCVFRTGVDFTALMPHALAARQVARVAVLKARREREKGDIDAAVGDVKAVLRLARDIQPRGYLIGQLVAVAMTGVVAREMVGPVLAAPGLRPEHCDALLAALRDHEARSIDGYAEPLKMEYVSTRVTLRELIREQDRLSRSMSVQPGASVVKALVQPVPPPAAKPGQPLPQGPEAEALPDDIDARLARTTPAELARVTEQLNAYYRALLALEGRTALEKVAAMPDPRRFLAGDEPLVGVVRAMLPAVGSVVQSLGRSDATLRAAECLVAVRRWQLTHRGANPADLADACRAAGLKDVPADPYDGKPLRMAVIGGEPVVYSIGKDGRDDGGKVDSDFDRQPGDQLHRLPPANPDAPR